MKLHLSLVAVVCFAAATFAQNQNPGGATRPADKPADTNKVSLDGTWTVIAYEKDGQAQKDATSMTVTVKDNTLTCSGKDGKPAMTVKFEFTGPGKAKVMMTDGGTTVATGTDRKEPASAARTDDRKDDRKDGGKEGSKEAVYVLTSDYLAVCVHDDTNKTGAITTEPSSKSKCSIILKRSGTGTGTGTGANRDK